MRVHDAAGGALGVLEQVLDDAGLPGAHQIEDGRREVLGQVVDERGRVVGRNLLGELGDLLRGPRGEKRRAGRAYSRSLSSTKARSGGGSPGADSSRSFTSR